MKHDEEAQRLFKSGANCAQAVFTAFRDLTGLDEVFSMKLASGMGAGMGRMRDTCGALSGAVLAYGCLMGYSDVAAPDHREQKSACYRDVRELAARFVAEKGTYNCRKLLNLKEGEEPVEPAVRTPEYYATRPCLGCIGCAARILDEMLEEKKKN